MNFHPYRLGANLEILKQYVIIVRWLQRVEKDFIMTISVTGLGSGLNYDSWITKLVQLKQDEIDKVNTQITNETTRKSDVGVLKTEYSSLLDSIQTLTKANTSASNVFAQKSASSSLAAVSASVTSSAAVQSVNVTVSKLATSTTAKSSSVVAAPITTSSSASAMAGKLTIYVDGTKHSITIGSSDTVGTVLSNITTETGLAATVDSSGKVTVGAGSSSTVTIGSNADTSNFINTLSLTKSSSDNSYTSSKSIYATDAGAKLTSTPFAKDAAGDSTVKAGTFTLGNSTFTIDSNTTLNSLITQINSDTKAGVTASWDQSSGKLTLTSTDQGATNINIEAGTSNFTDVMGLTTSTWNTDGSMKTTALATGSQTLGENASLTINGTTITSSSNTVTSDISGIAGLTLTLTDTTSTTAKVTVSQNTTSLENAIKSFVSSLNSVVTDTETATASSGDLYGETTLSSLRNKIRTMVTAGTNGSSVYKSLSAIGITTGAIGTSVDTDTSKLIIDTTKLEAALKNNPDEVKKLLIGDSTAGTSGVLSKLEPVVNGSLDTKNGYFAARSKSYDDEIKQMNTKVDNMTSLMKSYKADLEAKFSAMDTLISNMKKQASIFDQYFNKSSNSSNSSSSS